MLPSTRDFFKLHMVAMSDFAIRDGVWQALQDYRVPAPVMYSVTYSHGRWNQGELLPYGPIEILPGARALHFAEQVFEGMKAYKIGRANPNLFRASVNCAPLRRSAEAYSTGTMTVLIERQQVRAAAGGVGMAKTGANYAASLQASTRAVARNYTVALWLDLIARQNIEELSGMNVFAVIGAAAIVCPISMIGDDDREYTLEAIDVRARILRERLLAIQERRTPDPYGWTNDVPPFATRID